jgi:poly(beta-D-mannuronate) lyase
VFEGANRGDAVIRVDGAHARLTGLAFRDSGDPDDKNATLIKIFGPYAEVDHSTFADNVCGGIKVSPNPAEDGAAILASHAHIHHNVFRGSDRRFPNGCEPIQLGTGANGKLDGAALVEHNTFDRVNSDSEIISVKTSGNAIRNNTITDSDGYISLRVGRNNVVEGNVIVHGAWGISVADGGHVIVNNFIRDPRRQVGIYLIAARWKTFADGSLKQHYANAHDNLIMHNTVVAEIPLFFGNIFNSGITDSPAGNQFINNIFVVTGAATTAIDGNNGFSPSSALSANVFVRNLFYPQGGGTDFAVPLPGSGPDANLLGDPLLDFADPAVPRLRSGSAAIGAAKALAPAVGYDIRGAVRAGGADIGAYEYGDDD